MSVCAHMCEGEKLVSNAKAALCHRAWLWVCLPNLPCLLLERGSLAELFQSQGSVTCIILLSGHVGPLSVLCYSQHAPEAVRCYVLIASRRLR